MFDMATLCDYEKIYETEVLQETLLLTTLELEKLKSEANEEIRKNKEQINHLTHLLNCALHERDQAKSQLHNLLLVAPKTATFPAGANSGLTESDSPSDHDSFSDCIVISPSESEIDNLARGRVLPQKGKFLEAVVRAGPLLQTLLVAGPLPRWRNPPRFEPFRVPPPMSTDQAERNVGHFGSTGVYAPLVKRQRFC